MNEGLSIGVGALIAVLIGGVSMGYYISRLHHFYPPKGSWFSHIVSKVVFGWSFLIPLWVETKFFERGMMQADEWAAILVLWVAFSAMTVASNRWFSKKHREVPK